MRPKSVAPNADFQSALEAFQRGDLDSARAAAEEAVRKQPSPHWHHLLGLVLCRLGKLQDGVEHLRAAAQAEPRNLAFQVMLWRALIDAGLAAEVLALPEPPPITSAAALELWRARAEAADRKTDLAAAELAWGRIAAVTPGDWRAWANYGNALGAQHKWSESADALEKALALTPDDAAIRQNLLAALLHAGRAEQAQLRFDEAEAAFRRAYALAPSDRAVINQFGIALERTNRLNDLAKLLKDAAEAGIGKDQLPYLWAVLARREGRLEEARQLLIDSDMQDEPVRWYALRVKIADALGNAAEAFDAATTMNAMAVEEAVSGGDRDKWELDTQDYRAELHELARLITPEWAAQVPRLDDAVEQRVAFLVGFPRSGTTLLDTFLLGHPEVEVLEEKQLVSRAADVIGGSRCLVDASAEVLRKARSAYLRALQEHLPGSAGLVVDKFPLDMAAAPIIEAVFPGARLIFAQRHPCDVVLSGFLQPIGVVNFSNIEAAADYYDAMMSIWTAAREALDLNVHTVIYEELVRHPEGVLRPLVAFLGLDWDERILDHRSSARARGTIVTPSYDQVTEPITTSASGRWKRYREQLEPVLPVLLPWAERLGYED